MTGDADTSVDEVRAVIAALTDAGCRVWVGGGWGVDALAGRQTRPHRDLDLAVDADQEVAALTALARVGYVVELDLRPVRIELHARGRGYVDIHPIAFRTGGDAVQIGWGGETYAYPRAGFTVGAIDGHPVPCLSLDRQLAFHGGYEPLAKDLHNLAILERLRLHQPIIAVEEEHMHDKVNLAEKLALFSEHFQPKIVGRYNDNKLMVVKVQGEFVWHSHPETDDLFLVLDGRLTIRLRDGEGERAVELGPGELFVVPAGVEHCPFAAEETHVLLIEPIDTVNTGDAGGALTAEPEEI